MLFLAHLDSEYPAKYGDLEQNCTLQCTYPTWRMFFNTLSGPFFFQQFHTINLIAYS